MPLTTTPAALARGPRDLTAAWAQRVLDEAAPGARVASFEALEVDVGTTTRARLAVEHDGPADLPRRWFVKLPSGAWKARVITALPQLPQTEVRFYREVADDVSAARPRALAAVSRFGRGFTLVLGDVTEAGAVAGRPGDAITVEQADRVIDLLASLHARFWQDPRLLDGPLAWLSGRRLEEGLGTALAVPLMKRGLARAGEAVPAALHGPALRYSRERGRAMAALEAGPRTLVHHDTHAGNLFWRDGAPGLLDWQLVRTGEGVSDVAYLLATALLPDDRRAAEDALLARYREALAAHGGPRLEAGALRERYRAHLTYAFEAMVVTLAVGGLMTDDVARELSRRAAVAVADLDAFAALA